MTVRGAVEARENTPATVSPAAIIAMKVEEYSTVLRDILPDHMNNARFATTIVTACRANPDLFKCDPATIIAAAIKAAQLGLEPNDERGLCYLIPYGTKATFQLGYKGMVELGRRSGMVRRVVARTVHENDEFAYSYGTEDEGLKHTPTRGDDPGEAWAWYAIAWAPDGSLMDFVVLTRADVEYHRKFSQQPNGKMWKDSYDAAARKTAVRELFKLLPQSPQLAGAMAADDRVLRVEDNADGRWVEPEDVGDVTPYREHAEAIETGESS